MCYAILEISYATSERGTKTIELEEHFEAAITDLQDNSNVIKIRVFRAYEVLSRKSVWESNPP